MKTSPHSFRRIRILIPVAILAIALALIPTASIASSINRVFADAQSLQKLMQDGALQLLQADSNGELDSLLTQTIVDLRDLRASVGVFADWGAAMGWLPKYGGDLANASALLDFAEQVLVSAQETAVIGRAVNDEIEMGKSGKLPIGASVLRASQKQSAMIQHARQTLAQSVRSRSRIDAARLSPSLREMVARVDKLLPLWQVGLDSLALAPKFLGGDRPRTYLLLLQNSDELRATGGFISAVARVRVVQGDVTVSDFQDSYAVDDLSKPHPTPPDALRQYMHAGMWVLRDANWSPDFPTTARTVENIYRLDRGIEVDGVIAVNLSLLPRILEVIGPVRVNSFNERVDSSNAIRKIQTYWAPPALNQSAEYWQHRKDFAGSLLDAMMVRLRAGDLDRASLSRALHEAVAAKDLLVYINDFDTSDPSSLPWSGALYTGPGDVLMIVDSNLGFNKVDENIQRQAEYSVSLETNPIKAALTITYTNLSAVSAKKCDLRPLYTTTYAELQQGCYWDYVRVFAPAGSVLVSAAGLDDGGLQFSSEGRVIFAGYFVLARGESKTIRFEYLLPAKLKSDSKYSLILEKQPGKGPMPVLVRITLPTAWYEIFDSLSVRQASKIQEFSILLDSDHEFQVVLDQSNSAQVGAAIAIVGSLLAAVGLVVLRHRSP